MQSQKFIGDSMGPSSVVLTKSAMTGCMLKANRVSCQLFSRNIHNHIIITIITTTNIIIITITTTFIIII
jgi:hypothetical protein